MLNNYKLQIVMRKFIALKNDVYYSVEQEGDKISFYANQKGTAYDTRKDVTPKVLPNKNVFNEIIKRPTISSEMSGELEKFISTLEERHKEVTK